MGDFKDMVQEDIKSVFLDFDMFGEIHKLNGKDVLIIPDENELVEREKLVKDLEQGLYNRQFLFYVSAEDFGKMPKVGRILNFDGKDHKITGATNESGIYSISMEEAKAWS